MPDKAPPTCPNCGKHESEMMARSITAFGEEYYYHAGWIEITTLASNGREYLCGSCGAHTLVSETSLQTQAGGA